MVDDAEEPLRIRVHNGKDVQICVVQVRVEVVIEHGDRKNQRRKDNGQQNLQSVPLIFAQRKPVHAAPPGRIHCCFPNNVIIYILPSNNKGVQFSWKATR